MLHKKYLGDVPDSGGLNNVPDDELLDGLVLGAGLKGRFFIWHATK